MNTKTNQTDYNQSTRMHFEYVPTLLPQNYI